MQPGSCPLWSFAHRLLGIVPPFLNSGRVCSLSRRVFARVRELPVGQRLGESPPQFSQVRRAGISALGRAGSGAGGPRLWLSGDCSDFAVQVQGQVESHSAIAIGPRLFRSPKPPQKACPVGCAEELRGHRRRGARVRAACPGDAAGPLGPRPACVAQMCLTAKRGVGWGSPGLFPSREGGARSSRPGWKVSPDGWQPALGTGFKGLLLGH